tara:strand:- start:199694 stop:200503 length:810 start_codon:yes stop_codon:yes gene_type:complete
VDHLTKLYQRASLEARTDATDQTVFGVQFVRFIEGIKDFTNGMVGNGVFGFTGQVERVRSKEDYMAVRNTTVYRPLHLAARTTMLQLAEVIEENFKLQKDIESRVFAPWRAVLANFLTNPSELKKLYDVDELKKGKLIDFVDIADIHKDVKKVYSPSNSQATDTFGNLYRNYKEWEETCKIVAKLNEEAIRLNFEGIVRQAEELNEMAGRLADHISESPEEYEISKSAQQLLAEASYMVGRELEYLGSTGAMLDSISGAIASTADILKK